MAQWQLPVGAVPLGAKVVGDSVSRARRATPPRGVGLLSLAELPLPSSHEGRCRRRSRSLSGNLTYCKTEQDMRQQDKAWHLVHKGGVGTWFN